ncbi:MAG TPA: WcaF family extracellular polysaccharide biosynthesis acetyltransferase [Bdellovibrionota bacterium]|nr:WcaF family extracellular polysaccharide biosynthesis acetyltransferase [Bdellovibrionota bacterium]
MTSIDLSKFDNRNFRRGRSYWIEVLWRVVSAILFQSSWFPFYAPKRFLLRCFGGSVGRGVLIKPRVTITFPWKLRLGDFSWVGEEVWLDSLDEIRIGAHACIAQRAYLCTGTHDSRIPTFDLLTKAIEIGDGAWVGAGSSIAPGVHVGPEAFIQLGSVVVNDVPSRAIVRGNPAQKTGERKIESR